MWAINKKQTQKIMNDKDKAFLESTQEKKCVKCEKASSLHGFYRTIKKKKSP